MLCYSELLTHTVHTNSLSSGRDHSQSLSTVHSHSEKNNIQDAQPSRVAASSGKSNPAELLFSEQQQLSHTLHLTLSAAGELKQKHRHCSLTNESLIIFTLFQKGRELMEGKSLHLKLW